MGFVQDVRESFARLVAPRVAEVYEVALRRERNRSEELQESMTTIEMELENLQYQRLTNLAPQYQYTQRHVMRVVQLATQMALKNPITVRSVNVQADYVFGQGVTFNAKHPYIQEVIDEFVNYIENQKSLTSHTAMLRAERRQMTQGSVFFVLNTNRKTGRVIVRMMPTVEVADIILDPNDRDKEWYIKHSYTDPVSGTVRYTYHPAYGVDEYSGTPKPWSVPGEHDHQPGEILWDAPILHVAANKLGVEKFAMPELYPQLDWALAYKRSLEQWITIIAAYARMAMKVTGLNSKKQAATAKSLLQTSMNLTNPLEGNPSVVPGSTGLFGKGVDAEPIKTAGATTPASEADPIANMAGCAVGLPNTFFGDAGKGNFATATTLDRPTELKMRSRQILWSETLTYIIRYAILQAVIAPQGILAQYGATYTEEEDPFTGYIAVVPVYPANKDAQHGTVGKPIDAGFEVHFPEILERNVADRVRSLVNAATLFGKQLTDVIPDKRLVAKLLLQALNIPNAESYIPAFVQMWEANMKIAKGQGTKQAEPYIIPPAPPAKGGGPGAEDAGQGGDVGDNG